MTDFKSRIAAVVGSAPADLVAYYEAGDFPRYPAGSINCLPFEEAEQYTRHLTDPALVRLGLWVLDDANDSSPYCCITRGPCAGAILHLTHDGEPAIAFPSLQGFLTELRRLVGSGGSIDDLVRDLKMAYPLDAEILGLCREGTEAADFSIGLYLPVCGSLGAETKQALASHKNMFVREAFSHYLKRRPAVEDLAFAERLAGDPMAQVACPAKEARSAINRLKWKR